MSSVMFLHTQSLWLKPLLASEGRGQWLVWWPGLLVTRPPPAPPPGLRSESVTRSTGLSVTSTLVTAPPRTPGLTPGPWCPAQCRVWPGPAGLTIWCHCSGPGPDTIVTLSPGLRFSTLVKFASVPPSPLNIFCGTNWDPINSVGFSSDKFHHSCLFHSFR